MPFRPEAGPAPSGAPSSTGTPDRDLSALGAEVAMDLSALGAEVASDLSTFGDLSTIGDLSTFDGEVAVDTPDSQRCGDSRRLMCGVGF